MSKETNKKNAVTEEKREKIIKAVEEIEKTSPKQTQSKPKQLTMAKIKREAKEINKMEKYELNDNDSIRFYPVFPYGKIDDLLQEYQEKIRYAVEKDIMFPEEKTLQYIYFLCIKYSTSLEKAISDKYEDQILQMSYLVDTGYLKQIVEEVFLPSEINKVMDRISELLSTFQLIEHVNEKVREKTADLKIKNKEILNVLAKDPYEKLKK